MILPRVLAFILSVTFLMPPSGYALRVQNITHSPQALSELEGSLRQSSAPARASFDVGLEEEEKSPKKVRRQRQKQYSAESIVEAVIDRMLDAKEHFRGDLLWSVGNFQTTFRERGAKGVASIPTKQYLSLFPDVVDQINDIFVQLMGVVEPGDRVQKRLWKKFHALRVKESPVTLLAIVERPNEWRRVVESLDIALESPSDHQGDMVLKRNEPERFTRDKERPQWVSNEGQREAFNQRWAILLDSAEPQDFILRTLWQRAEPLREGGLTSLVAVDESTAQRRRQVSRIITAKHLLEASVQALIARPELIGEQRLTARQFLLLSDRMPAVNFFSTRPDELVALNAFWVDLLSDETPEDPELRLLWEQAQPLRERGLETLVVVRGKGGKPRSAHSHRGKVLLPMPAEWIEPGAFVDNPGHGLATPAVPRRSAARFEAIRIGLEEEEKKKRGPKATSALAIVEASLEALLQTPQSYVGDVILPVSHFSALSTAIPSQSTLSRHPERLIGVNALWSELLSAQAPEDEATLALWRQAESLRTAGLTRFVVQSNTRSAHDLVSASLVALLSSEDYTGDVVMSISRFSELSDAIPAFRALARTPDRLSSVNALWVALLSAEAPEDEATLALWRQAAPLRKGGLRSFEVRLHTRSAHDLVSASLAVLLSSGDYTGDVVLPISRFSELSDAIPNPSVFSRSPARLMNVNALWAELLSVQVPEDEETLALWRQAEPLRVAGLTRFVVQSNTRSAYDLVSASLAGLLSSSEYAGDVVLSVNQFSALSDSIPEGKALARTPDRLLSINALWSELLSVQAPEDDATLVLWRQAEPLRDAGFTSFVVQSKRAKSRDAQTSPLSARTKRHGRHDSSSFWQDPSIWQPVSESTPGYGNADVHPRMEGTSVRRQFGHIRRERTLRGLGLEEDLVAVSRAVEQTAQVHTQIAVLVDPSLLVIPEGMDAMDLDMRLSILGVQLREAMGYEVDELTLNIALLTPAELQQNRANGYYVIQVQRNMDVADESLLPLSAVPMLALDALRFNQPVFWADVTLYLGIGQMSMQELLQEIESAFSA